MKLNQITKSNVKGFFQGYWRAFQLYVGLDINYKKEVFFYRIGKMDFNCILKKECPCSCAIVYKQLEDRSCENNCYEPMMSKDEWKLYRENSVVKSRIELGKWRIQHFDIKIPEAILKHLNQ